MKSLAMMLAVSLAMATSASVALADTETTTTTVRTTTVGYALPAGDYVVVNPITGTVVGPYDTTVNMVNGQPVPIGTYVIEKTSGRVLATTDASGTLIAFTSVPTTLPAHFLLVNGQLVYTSDDCAFRRAKIEAQITEAYAHGKLSNHDVKELREGLAEIASLETKRKSDGTFSSSTSKRIERRFSEVQADLSKDISEINSKRAKIGIKVD